jgi:DNA-3-methyladenine glycosylase
MLDRSFFARPTLDVARALLGTRLVRLEGDQRLAGIISETEAYIHETDLACHAKAGRTPRTQVMYGPPGHAYVYFTYGMHWCLNFVTEEEGTPAAVLIRAIEPTEGLTLIASRRAARPVREWCNGPGKLCQALGVDRSFNAADICLPESCLFVEPGEPISDHRVTIGPRVGLTNVPEPWKSMPWRFRTIGDPVSGAEVSRGAWHLIRGT